MVVSQELVGRKFVADLDIYDATWAQQRGNIANGGNGIQDVFQNILGENYVEQTKLWETFLITDIEAQQFRGMVEGAEPKRGPVEAFLVDLDARYGFGAGLFHDDEQAAVTAADVQDVFSLERTPRRQYAGNFAATLNVAAHVVAIGVVIYSVDLRGQELIEGRREIARIGRRRLG